MLEIDTIQSFSFKMSVENLIFPVKIEEDQKLFIDLDTEGNSPEDIVIEWHLEMRRFFASYAGTSGETKLIAIMKEYITTITERAIHFEDIVRLKDMVDKHMEHIYWFYADSNISLSDMYLDYMEHILTFYVNLTLRVLLVLKKKIKVTQKKVNDMTQKVIKQLSFYLLRSEHHIFHVLIRQTTTLVDGMIKDVINILNSNICKQMFRNLYMHYIVSTPPKDMSDEAFCRAYILFENWKAFEDYKQNQKIEACVKKLYGHDQVSISENEFLRRILMPERSIMSDLLKVMGCDPSITKAYFDYIKSKASGASETIDDISKLALDDAVSETELTDEEDFEKSYLDFFDKLMVDATYNLEDVLLTTASYKNEGDLSVSEGNAADREEIFILDTDSDSDVEIVSIVPSLNSTRPVTNGARRSRNSAKNTQPTSFLDSISLEVDTSRRKYGFRNLGNTDNSSQKKTADTNQTTNINQPPPPNTTEDHDSDIEVVEKPVETCLIMDDDVCATNDDKTEDLSTNKNSTSNNISNSTHNSPENEVSVPDIASVTNAATILPEEPIAVAESSSVSDVPSSESDIPSSVPDVRSSVSDLRSLVSDVASSVSVVPSSVSDVRPSISDFSSSISDVRSSMSDVPSSVSDVPSSVSDVPPSVSDVPSLEKSVISDSSNIEQSNEDNSHPVETCNIEMDEQSPSEKSSMNEDRNAETPEESLTGESAQQSESISLEKQLDALSITSSESTADKVNGCLTSTFQTRENKVNGNLRTNSNECQTRDRTLKSDKTPEVLESRTEPLLEEPTRCESGCGEEETTNSHSENNEELGFISDITSEVTNRQSEERTPLDTGQELTVQPLDTGQFDADSPASPEHVEVYLKSLCGKNEVKSVSEPLLGKGQHSDFGFPTPPGSEEERDKESDDQTKLIYSTILPTQNIYPRDSENEQVSQITLKTHTPNSQQNEDFLSEEIDIETSDINIADNQLLLALSDKQKGDTSPSLSEFYEQIVRDAIGSKNTTEEDDIQNVLKNYKTDNDQDIDFDEMEQFLKSCDKEDYPQGNRKKRKIPREKANLEECRSKKNSFTRSPKRVKINDEPETHFITTSYGEDSNDEVWEEIQRNRRPSPMPLLKYLSKKNGEVDHSPLSGRFSPKKSPLKGILKQIEKEPIYEPLDPIDDGPETVLVVLHHQDIGRGKMGSIEVKANRKSFANSGIPVDDCKLCTYAYVELETIDADQKAAEEKIPTGTRLIQEKLFNELDKPMYKVVFDKQTPQLNSNDRKYFYDPSKPSSANSKSKSTLLGNEQGTVNLSEITLMQTPEPVEPIGEPGSKSPEPIEPNIQTPISPPCFSPSSNSSSEFSDPTNLIPYQDIERALQVVEPNKQGDDITGCSLECNDSNDSLEKSLVDRIAMETIELLSNNADFHKMLRDLNGDVLIENIPLIGIEENIGNVTVVSETGINDDLVSNLNSDEQLLKKVCQELESQALVDNLNNDLHNSSICTDDFLDVNVEDDSNLSVLEMKEQEISINDTDIESDKICVQDYEIHVSSSVSNMCNDTLLHAAIPSSVPITYSETTFSAVNTLPESVKYVSSITTVPNSSHKESFPSIPDSTFVRSVQSHSSFLALNSPQVAPKHSAPIHNFPQDTYSVLKQCSTNQTIIAETTVSNAASLARQQTFTTIPQLPLTYSSYSETAFAESSSLGRISAPAVSPILNLNHQETFSSVPGTLLHSNYSDKNVTSPLTVFSASNSPHQSLPSNVELKSFLPEPSSSVPVYLDDSLQSTSSTLLSYSQSNSRVSTSTLYTDNFGTNCYSHNLTSTLPTYTNCMIPNVPLALNLTENKSIITSNPPSVISHPERVNPGFRGTTLNAYIEPSTPFPRVADFTYAPQPKIHSLESSRYPPSGHERQTKTNSSRKRLPKEVLTISQLNKSPSPNKDCMDNNLKRNDNGNTKKSGNPDVSLQTALRTNELCNYTSSKDPRVGQPLICVPPPFIRGLNFTSLVVNLPVSPEILKKLVRKKSHLKKNRTRHKVGKLRNSNDSKKSVTKAKSTNLTPRQTVNVASSLGVSENVSEMKMSQNLPIDVNRVISTSNHVTKVPTAPVASKKITASLEVQDTSKSFPGAIPKNDPVPSLEAPQNVVYSAGFLTNTRSNLDIPPVLVAPKNIVKDTETLLKKSKTDTAKNLSLEKPKIILKETATFTRELKSDTRRNLFLETPKNNTNDAKAFTRELNNVTGRSLFLEAPKIISGDTAFTRESNDTSRSIFSEAPMKLDNPITYLTSSKKDVQPTNLVQTTKNISKASTSSPIVKEVLATPTVMATHTPQVVSITDQPIPKNQSTKQTKSKPTGRKRGRPPKNAKTSSKNNNNTDVQNNIPTISTNIPSNDVHERVPPIYHAEMSQRRYPTTRNASQPRVEPLKIIKDPKKGYNKVVKVSSNVQVKSTPLPMPVPETYNFEGDTQKTELYNLKPPENNDNEVEFETHLPLKKRKLSMPVSSGTQAQPTTLANVPRSRDKKEEISYPATPMLSIADVYMQPRSFKTAAEKKQLPPESSNSVPIHYEVPPVPDGQFNCSLNNYNPALYAYSKCPYGIELECNSYCTPPVLFPPEPFSHTN